MLQINNILRIAGLFMKNNSIVYEEHRLLMQDDGVIFHLDTVGALEDAAHFCYRRSCPVNWHENIELLFFLAGTATVYIDGRPYLAEAGQLFVINAQQLHHVASEGETRYYCMIPDRNLTARCGLDTSTVRFDNCIRDEDALRLFAAAADELTADRPYRAGAVRAAVLSLLVRLFRHCAVPTEGAAADREHDPVKDTVEYINAHLAEPLTLEMLAVRVNLSRYHFSRLFARHMGCTVVHFINHRRCLLARNLLCEGGYTVAEAAALSGFDNLSYFAKTFRRYIGVLPSDLKSRH